MSTSLRKLAALVWLAHYTYAIPQASTTLATTSVPTVIISTSVPSPTVPLNSLVPSQAVLPPVQPWCIGQIFCPGQLLQIVNLAQPYSDAKTIVDKPTSKSSQQVLADFAAFNLSTLTEGNIVNLLDNDFLGEGSRTPGCSITGIQC
ncbi:hypothetical protein JVT61DRAFT_11947 [Boletus reticuloceps]|uniref:Uncharacterized protein n=1 Tax=Boletus reticuloceps TaxID=495285 RepID=A0A8I2YW32_9AGAM|nr:hypothetical protein JVT61DRAFT_11947 [Boletus reticuloceps]